MVVWCVALGLWAIGTGAGAPPPTAADPSRPARIDAQTGRWLAVEPPPRPVDLTHITLEMDLDMQRGRAAARATLHLEAVGTPRGRFTLDAMGLDIGSVTLDGRPVAFEVAPGALTILPDPPLAPGEPATLVVEYLLPEITNDGYGLSWSPRRPGGTGPTDLAPQIHAQGQSVFNSQWFPCRDAPDERLTSTLIVTADDGFEVLSNGRLARRETLGGRTRWTWVQGEPHPVYLITLVVGRYEVLDVGGGGSARPGLAMPVYAPVGEGARTALVLGRTAEMIAFMEAYVDEPYPWDRYAQAICRDFRWGGMENTGATVLNQRVAEAHPGSEDGLIMHEIAHQWLGNLVTCASWEHLWLNEGWATFAELLWFEHVAAPGERGSVRASVLGSWRDELVRGEPRTAPEWAAMRSPYFEHPDDTFIKTEDPYLRGAFVLHMLRAELGEEVFQRVAAAWIDTHRQASADTEDFRRVAERVSGRSLERFFEQWVDRPGVPRVRLEPVWTGRSNGSGVLTVRVEQTQPIDRLNPAYCIGFSLHIEGEGVPTRRERIEMDAREAVVSLELPGRPSVLRPDPELDLLAAWDVRPITD